MAPKRKKVKILNEDGDALSPSATTLPTSSEPLKDSFLRLPPELRFLVYSHLFPDKQVPAVRYLSDSIVTTRRRLRNDGQKCHLAIASTCRLIYEEASDILYGSVPYSIEVRGAQISACLSIYNHKAKSRPYCCSYHRKLWKQQLEQKTRTQSETPCRNHFSTLFSFVRNLEVVIFGGLPDDWGHVHGLSKRNELSDQGFDEMFEIYDVRDTVSRLPHLLEDAPRLEHVKISVSWPGWYSASGRARLHVFDATWLLNGLKSARNLKSVTFGKIAPPRLENYTENAEDRARRGEEREAKYDGFKTATAALMMGDSSPEKSPTVTPAAFATLPSLIDLVRQFKGTSLAHPMCKALYQARHAEATNNVRRYEKEKDDIMKLWEKEEERLKALLENVKAPLKVLREDEDEDEDEDRGSPELGSPHPDKRRGRGRRMRRV